MKRWFLASWVTGCLLTATVWAAEEWNQPQKDKKLASETAQKAKKTQHSVSFSSQITPNFLESFGEEADTYFGSQY